MAAASRMLQDLQFEAWNKICVDWSSKNPQWASISYNIFICLECSNVMKVVSRKGESNVVNEVYVWLTLAGVLVCDFVTDFIRIHSILGDFVFRLMILKNTSFARRMMERIEDFVLGLLLLLYFASSGLKIDVTTIRGGAAWRLLCLVIFTVCAGKILGTFLVAMFCMIPARESLTPGVSAREHQRTG